MNRTRSSVYATPSRQVWPALLACLLLAAQAAYLLHGVEFDDHNHETSCSLCDAATDLTGALPAYLEPDTPAAPISTAASLTSGARLRAKLSVRPPSRAPPPASSF